MLHQQASPEVTRQAKEMEREVLTEREMAQEAQVEEQEYKGILPVQGQQEGFRVVQQVQGPLLYQGVQLVE